jgi:hypothetical protein
MAIEDQQQFKDMDSMMKMMKYAKAFFPTIVETSNEEIGDWEKQMSELKTLPDRFNRFFLPQGWVFTANMSTEAAEEALRIADTSGMEAAEEHLEDYYEKNWWFLSLRLFAEMKKCPQIGLANAVARQELIELAWQDHKDKRYHATVPIITAQIDGIIQDLTGKSFFNKKDTEHLSANETLASDPTALPELAKMMSRSRSKTTTEPLDVPQRHGVQHGRDLGYGTRRTSTQAFATLLSLTELIEAITKGEQFKVPEPEFLDPDTATWQDVIEIWKDVLKSVKEYGEWQRENEASKDSEE